MLSGALFRAVQIGEELRDVGVVQLLDAQGLRQLPEAAHGPLPVARVGRLEPELLRPGALLVGHGVGRRVVGEPRRQMDAGLPRAADTTGRAARASARLNRSRALAHRSTARASASRATGRTPGRTRCPDRVRLVAMVIRGIGDEGHVREVDLELQRRQVVLVGNRNALGRRVVEAALARVRVREPVRPRSFCCRFWNMKLGVM